MDTTQAKNLILGLKHKHAQGERVDHCPNHIHFFLMPQKSTNLLRNWFQNQFLPNQVNSPSRTLLLCNYFGIIRQSYCRYQFSLSLISFLSDWPVLVEVVGL